MQSDSENMHDASMRLECIRLVVDYHPEFATVKERLEHAEALFKYLKTGIIPKE